MWKILFALAVSVVWQHLFSNLRTDGKSRTLLCSHLFCWCLDSNLVSYKFVRSLGFDLRSNWKCTFTVPHMGGTELSTLFFTSRN